MRENPFSLDFGMKPSLYIPRYEEQRKIIETFSSETPSAHIFLLTGARGSGKTVLMTSVSAQLRESSKWIHIDLNSEGDLLNTMASAIYQSIKAKLPRLKLNVSLGGFQVEMEQQEKYYDVQTDLDTMLRTLEKRKIRVLITIDEVYNAQNIRLFTSYFQHCLRENLSVFVLMTGLYKNIRALQNNRSQTFLKRAPKINLSALNSVRIAQKYKEIFEIDQETAAEMARLTAGYSYGFQILGYLVYDAGKNKPDEHILSEYKLYLEESSYDKIWEELSAAERKVAAAIAKAKDNAAVKDVRELLDIDSNSFSTYKDTLIKSGLLSLSSAYGHVNFCLPFFREYILEKEEVAELSELQ